MDVAEVDDLEPAVLVLAVVVLGTVKVLHQMLLWQET